MRVELVGFSQDVTLATKDERINFFNFRSEEGKEFRIPVTEEAMQLLLAQVYGDEPVEQERLEAELAPVVEEEPDATIFGDEPLTEPRAPPDDVDLREVFQSRPRVPRREEDVPSL